MKESELSFSSQVNGLEVWSKFKESEIPGSTRVPLREFFEIFGSLRGRKILDVGSGSGRSTSEFVKLGAQTFALDLSFLGLKNTKKNELKIECVQASAESIPFVNDVFDGVNLCGLLTNLTDSDPNKAKVLRSKVLKELYRVLMPGGLLIASDFCAEHYLTNYMVSYQRHALITGEQGTIAVFDRSKNISFRGLSDNEVAQLRNSPDLIRFAHHYTPKELVYLLRDGGFKVLKYSVEIGSTPSGNPIENIIVIAKKEE